LIGSIARFASGLRLPSLFFDWRTAHPSSLTAPKFKKFVPDHGHYRSVVDEVLERFPYYCGLARPTDEDWLKISGRGRRVAAGVRIGSPHGPTTILGELRAMMPFYQVSRDLFVGWRPIAVFFIVVSNPLFTNFDPTRNTGEKPTR
jgi:hypothetical protein